MLLAEREPGTPLWEAPLVLEGETSQRGADARSVAASAPVDARDMPVVAIEPPQVASLEAAAGTEVAAAAAKTAAPGAHFFVVRLDFSLRPRPGHVRVEWARLRCELLAADGATPPSAEDMHPWTVEEKVPHHVSLEVSPSLKFSEVAVSAGTYTHNYDYETLEPVISAAGRGGPDLTWDFTAFHDGTVTGGKRMHALLSVPPASGAVQARLSFSADLVVERRFRRPATLPTSDTRGVIELIPAETLSQDSPAPAI